MKHVLLSAALFAMALCGCKKTSERAETAGSGAPTARKPAVPAPASTACAAGFTKAPSGGVCLKLEATCKFADQSAGDKDSHTSHWKCETPEGGGEVSYMDVWDYDYCLKTAESGAHAGDRTFIATGDLPNTAGKWFSYKLHDLLGIEACAKSSNPNGSYLINCDAGNGGGGEASVESVKGLQMLAN